jgi:hypothetical protein
MAFNAAALQMMLDKGLSLADVVEIAAANEVRSDPTAAERKRKQRAKERAERDKSHRDVTRDTGFNERDNLTSREELPQEANASLPQGAKPRCVWACPPLVDSVHWRDFLKNRRTKHLTNSETAYRGQLRELDRLADDEWPPGRLVQHAAEKGWASINDPRKTLHGSSHERPDKSPIAEAYNRVFGAG